MTDLGQSVATLKGGVMESQSQAMAGPGQTPEELAERRAKLNARVRTDLWKAVWEASRVMSYDEIREYVEGVIEEIVDDEP